jgi:hypothetical protein
MDTATATGTLHVMDSTGDTRLMWDKGNEDEVSAARRTFRDLKAKGYLAYSVRGKKGEKGTVLREFDPDAERIIMSPQLVGG